jgi:hypothetical protein
MKWTGVPNLKSAVSGESYAEYTRAPAVDRAAEAADQRRHFGAERKLAAGAGFYEADTFDPADLGCFSPFPRCMCISAWLIPNALI